ncbi:MAG: hypothetical protein IK065_03500 [Neisseriaceae bacterium]|nr:hypothetical protein [Neisseriaceae bacterium]
MQNVVFHSLKETPAKPLLKQKFNPAVGWDNTTNQNAAGVNLLYFNNFLFSSIGRFGGQGCPPYGVSFSKIRFCRGFLNNKKVCRKAYLKTFPADFFIKINY